jgi:hypothetical protein
MPIENPYKMVGPGKRVEVSIKRIWYPDNEIHVSWHRRQNMSDELASSSETLPSKL